MAIRAAVSTASTASVANSDELLCLSWDKLLPFWPHRKYCQQITAEYLASAAMEQRCAREWTRACLPSFIIPTSASSSMVATESLLISENVLGTHEIKCSQVSSSASSTISSSEGDSSDIKLEEQPEEYCVLRASRKGKLHIAASFSDGLALCGRILVNPDEFENFDQAEQTGADWSPRCRRVLAAYRQSGIPALGGCHEPHG